MIAMQHRRRIHEGQAKTIIEAFLDGRISEKQLINMIIENAQVLHGDRFVNELKQLTAEHSKERGKC